jgi:hypothetical protein
MTDESCVEIKIVKDIPFFGEGIDSLESRLRKVSLRGFPNVKIYENATFRFEYLNSKAIPQSLHTPQARVYQPNLDRIKSLQELFLAESIDVLNLQMAYDFTATSADGKETEWTMMPPITEEFRIPRSARGTLDYKAIVGDELMAKLKESNLGLNPDALDMPHANTKPLEYFNLVNDGIHRVHFGLQQEGVLVVTASNITPGFPYYAAPQKYEELKVFPDRAEALKDQTTKVHIVESPGHKELYRLFPSGGIKSGDIRYDPRIHGDKKP